MSKNFEANVIELNNRMEKHLLKKGPLMPTLHDAQEIFGAIPLAIGYALSYARATLSMPLVFAWSAILIFIVILVDYFLLKRLKESTNL